MANSNPTIYQYEKASAQQVEKWLEDPTTSQWLDAEVPFVVKDFTVATLKSKRVLGDGTVEVVKDYGLRPVLIIKQGDCELELPLGWLRKPFISIEDDGKKTIRYTYEGDVAKLWRKVPTNNLHGRDFRDKMLAPTADRDGNQRKLYLTTEQVPWRKKDGDEVVLRTIRKINFFTD